ncbi:hypothetical protein [Brevibacterium antiquum]|uniref:Uncharacterized protein n=1 Tax=Brevibacterium antiquum TaxID=234835 RepID=A0A2H1IMR9_9MICO|nr:hypothetical protein [Brevibacterium antiquum]SMX76454.1 hypothetical protein BANT10_01096 [Brevibacterium antiquum]
MKHFTAKTAAANFIRSDNSIDIEFRTTDGEQVIVSIPAGIDCDLLEGDEHGDGSLESAVVDASYYRNRSAA